MVKFLSPFWTAAVCLQIVWLVQRMQNVNRISNCQGRAEGRNFLLQVSSMWCGSDRQVRLFTKATEIKYFPLKYGKNLSGKNSLHLLTDWSLSFLFYQSQEVQVFSWGMSNCPCPARAWSSYWDIASHVIWPFYTQRLKKRKEKTKIAAWFISMKLRRLLKAPHPAEGSSEVGLLPRQGKCSISYVNPTANICKD